VISGSAAAEMSDADLLQDDRKLRLPVAARYPSPSLDKLELSNPTSLLSISVCCSNNLSKLSLTSVTLSTIFRSSDLQEKVQLQVRKNCLELLSENGKQVPKVFWSCQTCSNFH
jgi:hypothetical protein